MLAEVTTAEIENRNLVLEPLTLVGGLLIAFPVAPVRALDGRSYAPGAGADELRRNLRAFVAVLVGVMAETDASGENVVVRWRII